MMDTTEKAFRTFNWEKSKIDLSRHVGAREMRPTELHLKEDGSLKDEPVFTMVMEHPGYHPVFGQISLEMLNEGLEEIGYTIKKLS